MRVLCVGGNVFLAIIKLSPNGEADREESRLRYQHNKLRKGAFKITEL